MATPHFTNNDLIRDRCIQLYCLIKAPCPEESDGDPLLDAFVFSYRYNISNLLLEIATRARVLDDIMRADDSEHVLGKRQHDEVVAKYEKGGNGELPLREILNKVIHADLIELVCDGFHDELEEELRVCRNHLGDVTLKGLRSKQDWIVRLSPVPFCREVLGWLNDVDEMGRLHKLYQ